LRHTGQVLKSTDNQSNPVLPVNMEVTYTITVHPDVVPDGEKIRCWLPWPKKAIRGKKEIKLINSSNPKYIIAPDTAIHRTLYMEEVAKKRESCHFSDILHLCVKCTAF